MATLMKAKTAYTKAKSVDQLQLALDYVAKEINSAVTYGGFKVNVYVESEYLDDVKTTLLAAGYSVSSPVGQLVPASVKYTKKGFFAKFLSWFDRDDSPGDGIYEFPVLHGYITVDWSLVRELHKA